VKLYPKPAVRPVVTGRAKVVPAGGLTNPTETFNVSLALKSDKTKSPGSWFAVLKEKLGGGGAVIVAPPTASAPPLFCTGDADITTRETTMNAVQ
jgi:hypothetical protein